MKIKYLIILMLLISFGSIGAISFTPGLPLIANFFSINSQQAGLTVTWYLFGYMLGQLLYGPLANRYGSRTTIILASTIEIISAIMCIASSYIHSFELLLIGRFCMALGAGGGLTMSFIISSKICHEKEHARVISLLTIAFAITPGLGVFIGGFLVSHCGWVSSFYFMLIYGISILILGSLLPEVVHNKVLDALAPKRLINSYINQFNRQVVFGGLLVSSGTCVVYTFAALAPFIAMNIIGITPEQYGIYNFVPVIGMVIGSLLANYLGKIFEPKKSIKIGLLISLFGVIILFMSLKTYPHLVISLFAPMFLIYIGFSFIFGNGSAIALSSSKDKSNASALMSFVNMSYAVIIVMVLGLFPIHSALILPLLFIIYITFGIVCYFLCITPSKLNKVN
mgnify:CR=1 FL=1